MDWHVWQPPDGSALLWHAPSCSAMQLSEEATRLFELALEGELFIVGRDYELLRARVRRARRESRPV